MAPGGKGLIHTYFFPVGWALGGFTTMVFINHRAYRPLWSGIHRHVALGVAGFILGTYIDKFWNNWWSERDALIRHYIELHPEDFQDEKKRKYKEVFDAWYPQR